MNTEHKKLPLSKLLFLSLAALGVVYGDIGTSPLYTVNEIFFGKGELNLNRDIILGGIGLIIWSLTLMISFKYIVYVMRADYDGEGGVFALGSLIEHIKNFRKNKFFVLIAALMVFAAGLLFGDGMITPAISVVSAVEGLKIATTTFAPFIVPITVVILIGLFAIQRQGTAKVGTIFGPVLLLWFLVIGGLGLSQILKYPGILAAINPIYIVKFLSQATFYQILIVLGSVMLAITGGEAMYADMGHFGKKPIRFSWFTIVYPMLLLCYLGQGAYVLSGQTVNFDNVFYSMVPGPLLIPVVVLATLAAIIASQALISGAFSLASQATGLGLFPRLKIVQTHHEHEGQKYVPFVNWLLCFGSIALVLLFQSSTRLAAAYGFAVAGVMLITTLGLFIVANKVWNWSMFKVLLIFVPFLIINILFFIANSLKLIDGGYIPLAIGLGIFVIMKTWQWGKIKLDRAIQHYPTIRLEELMAAKNAAKEFLPRSVVIMTPHSVTSLSDKVPTLEQVFTERYGLLPKYIIFLTVVQHREPYMHHDRYHVNHFFKDAKKGSIMAVEMNFGFMEEPKVEKYLEGLAKHHEVDISEHHDRWLIHVLEDQMLPTPSVSFPKRLLISFFEFMDNNSISLVDYFGLGDRVRLSAEVFSVKVGK